MSLSRGVQLFRQFNKTFKNSTVGKIYQPSRNSSGGYSYRVGCYPHTRFQIVGSNLLGGLMWWWILWHIWHEPDHITGEFPWPDPSKWSNEELGIPPDDAD